MLWGAIYWKDIRLRNRILRFFWVGRKIEYHTTARARYSVRIDFRIAFRAVGGKLGATNLTESGFWSYGRRTTRTKFLPTTRAWIRIRRQLTKALWTVESFFHRQIRRTKKDQYSISGIISLMRSSSEFIPTPQSCEILKSFPLGWLQPWFGRGTICNADQMVTSAPAHRSIYLDL